MSVRRISIDLLAGGQEHHFLLVNDLLWPAKALALVETDAQKLADELNAWLESRGDKCRGQGQS